MFPESEARFSVEGITEISKDLLTAAAQKNLAKFSGKLPSSS